MIARQIRFLASALHYRPSGPRQQQGHALAADLDRNVAHEVDPMDEAAPQTDPVQSAFETALAEERRLWRAIHDPELRATDRVVAYARWHAVVERLKSLE